MTKERILDIMNCEDINTTEEETIEAFKMFFEELGVNINNEDGTFKSVYNIFMEAHNNFMKCEEED